MHSDSSRSGVEFRKTEVGPGEEKWGGCWGAMCCAENAGWKKSGDTCSWHSLTASPSQNVNSCDQEHGLFVLPNLAWRGKKQELFVSLSAFCSCFLEVEHTGASFPKPFLEIAACDAVVSTAEFTAFLIQWQELGSHTGGFGKAMVSVALSSIYKAPEVFCPEQP